MKHKQNTESETLEAEKLAELAAIDSQVTISRNPVGDLLFTNDITAATFQVENKHSELQESETKSEGRERKKSIESLSVSNEFVLTKFIARGGQGEVWKAFQNSLQREVAVKILLKGETVEFLQEAYTSAALDHPNILPVYDLGKERIDGREKFLLAMKLLNGLPWNKILQEERDTENFNFDDFLPRQLSIYSSLCNAVSFAHSKNIIHRDLKPHQVIVGEFGEAYLTDWGLALSLSDVSESHSTENVQKFQILSSATNPSGTPGYMAPEQTELHTKRLGIHTDIYLLGAVLFQILTGNPPHNGKTGDAAYLMAVDNRIGDYPDDAPKDLREICEKAMKTDPDDRFSTVGEIKVKIEDYLQGTSRRRESREIVSSVKIDYENSNDRNYSVFNRVEQRLIRAIQLWPNNHEAQVILDKVYYEHSAHSIKDGDLQLAETMASSIQFSPEQQKRLVSKIRKKRRELRRGQTQRTIAIASSIFLLSIVALGTIKYTVDQRNARENLLRQRDRAEVARGDAEDLMYFMLFKLKQDLKSIGRTDLLKDVADRSLRYYQELPTEEFGNDSLQKRAVAMLNIAEVFIAQGKLVEAKKSLDEALASQRSIVKKSPNNQSLHRDISATYSRLAEIQTLLGQNDAALADLNESEKELNLYISSNSDEASSIHGLSIIYEKQSEVLRQLGNTDEAIKKLEASNNLIFKLIEKEPTNPGFGRSLSVNLMKMGGLDLARGNVDKAKIYFGKALANRRILVSIDAGNATWKRDLSLTLMTLGQIEEQQGQLESSLKYYEEARDILKELSDNDPEDITRKSDYATIEDKLGTIHQKMGNMEEAVKYLQESERIRKDLTSFDSGNKKWQVEHISSLVNLGNLERATKKFEGALEHYRLADELLKSIVKEDDKNIIFKSYRSAINQNIGSVLSDLSRETEALAAFLSVVDLNREIADSDQKNLGYQIDLVGSFNKLSQLQIKMGDSEEALNSANQAVQLGTKVLESDSNNNDNLNTVAWSHVLKGRAEKLRGSQSKANESFETSVQLIGAVARETGHKYYCDTLAIALLELDRIDEARPIVDKLLEQDWDNSDFIKIIREKNLLEPGQLSDEE